VRYYGWYSNKCRGQRGKALPSAAAGIGLPSRPPRRGKPAPWSSRSTKPTRSSVPDVGPRCAPSPYRAASDRGDRENSLALRPMGGEPGAGTTSGTRAGGKLSHPLGRENGAPEGLRPKPAGRWDFRLCLPGPRIRPCSVGLNPITGKILLVHQGTGPDGRNPFPSLF
jgi:hypothetical protein